METVAEKTKTRLDWLDAVKALAILMVILHHTACSGVCFYAAYTSTVMLPLFAVASGFLHKTEWEQRPWAFVKKRFVQLIVPYVLLSLTAFLLGSVPALAEGTFIFKEAVWTALGDLLTGEGWYNLWFLPVLFLSQCLMLLLHRFLRGNDRLLAVTALVSLVAGYFCLPETRLIQNVNVVLIMFPMYASGYFYRRYVMPLGGKTVLWPAAVCAALFLALPFIVRRSTGAWPLMSLFGNTYTHYGLNMFHGACGCFAIMTFLRFLPLPGPLCSLGRNTLFYYGLHIPVSEILIWLLAKTVSPGLTAEILKSGKLMRLEYLAIVFGTMLLLMPPVHAGQSLLPAVRRQEEINASVPANRHGRHLWE